MNNNIKNFNDFRKLDPETRLDEGLFDNIGTLLGKGYDSITDVIKGKISAFLLSHLGIMETSIFSKLVQNFVEQIPIMDFVPIMFGAKAKPEYLAPKAADATMEFLVEKGLDGIAENLGIDPTGYLYRTIAEMFSNETKKAEFREKLEAFYLGVFGDFKPTTGDDFVKSLDGGEKSKMARTLRDEMEKKGTKLTSKQAEPENILTTFMNKLSSIGGGSKNSLGTTDGKSLGD